MLPPIRIVQTVAAFFSRLFSNSGGFADLDDYLRRALVHSGFSLLTGLVLFIIQPGQIVLNRKHVGLLGTDAAPDTSDLAHRPCHLAALSAAARNRQHILITERNHFD